MPGMHVTPERYGRLRAPWPPPPAPGSHTEPRSTPRLLTTGCDSIFDRSRGFLSRRFRLAGPGLGIGHSLAFDSLRRVRSTASLRFGCYPCLVQAESEPPGRLPPAPGSCLHRRVGPDFRQLSLLPIDRFHLAGPVDNPGPSLTFDSPRRVKPAASLRYGCYP